jgi:hypothetical protein
MLDNFVFEKVVPGVFKNSTSPSGRCYDPNFRRFGAILGKKIGVSLKTNVILFFASISFVLRQKHKFFSAKIF